MWISGFLGLCLTSLAKANVTQLTQDNFDSFIASHPKALVLFCTPWNTRCKRTEPAFKSAAEILATPTAAVDCKESPIVCKGQSVKTMPSIRLFTGMKTFAVYDGAHITEEIAAFAEQREPKDIPEVVKTLTESTLQNYVTDNKRVIVLFLEDDVGIASRQSLALFKEAVTASESKIQFAHMDCSGAKYCADMRIEKFPTVFYFRGGRILYPMYEPFTLPGLLEFFHGPNAYIPPLNVRIPAVPEPLFDADDKVTIVIENEDGDGETGMQAFVDSHVHAVVFFYSPWEPASMAVAGVLKEALGKLATNKTEASADVAVVDCTDKKHYHGDHCALRSVLTVPTTHYFRDGTGVLTYQSHPQDADAMLVFLAEPSSVPISQPAAYVEPTHEAFITKRSGEVDPAGESVEMLTDMTFYDFLSEHELVLVMFYAPWCGYCNEAKPGYAKLAQHCLDTNSKAVLAAVDCTSTGDKACSAEGVESYPTIKLFVNKVGRDYTGSREAAHYVDFINRYIPNAVSALPKEEL